MATVAAGRFSGGPKRILVCDDERHVVRLIQVNLERLGFYVSTAYNGQECLDKVRVERPQMVILDVMMPHMDGIEVLKTIRRDPQFEAMPVIVLSAKAQDQDVFHAYHCGADMFLAKPFNPKDLISFTGGLGQA